MSQISKFYSGRSVFITGGTGFVGKQVIEKLLRSCSDIERIYVLMREKKGLTIEQRLQETLSMPVFERLSMAQPNFHRKVVPVVGDVGEDHLGMSDADRQRLVSNVSVVIHSAATLNFMEPLRDAVNMNLLGVKRVLHLCKQMSHLESLVHVSTAYTQVNRKEIGEQTYDAPVAPDRLIDITRTLTDDELAVLTPYLLKLHNRPNTYTFTKSVSEKLVEQEVGNIPTAIIRPSIVGASRREPVEGVIDNYNGYSGICVGIGLGFIRCMITGPKVNVDIIPVDSTANAIIAASWDIAVKPRDPERSVEVYNLASGEDNRYCIRQLGYTTAKYGNKYKFHKIPGNRHVIFTESRLLNDFYGKCLTPLRFFMMDIVLRLQGKKPSMLKKLQQIQKLQVVLEYFTSNEWYWSTAKLRQLRERMNPTDKKEFDFDITDMVWDEYLEQHWLGVKKHLLKDPTQSPPAAPVDNHSKALSYKNV